MDYKELLIEMGFKLDWESEPVFQFSNEKILINVVEKKDGYHEFSACPRTCFDRWANSRHINWKLFIENYNEENGYGWTQENIENQFKQDVNDAIWFVNTLPERMFNQFITIDL